MDRLINMASFAEIVDAGGLSAAAERLNCSRAVVSKRLSALEQDFGVTLLNRTTRRQSLTEAGQTLYAHCRRMLDEMLSAETRLHEFSASPSGTLRVSAPHSYGTRVLSKRLPEFLQRYPDIRLELQLADQLADLAGTAVDIAVRLTDKPAPGLVARKLVGVPYVVCASPDYLRRHGKPQHPHELVRHNCLYYVGGIIQTPWHFDGPDGHSVVEVQGSLTVNSVEVLRDAVVGGLGIVAISRYHLTDEIARGDIVELLQDYRLPERAIYLMTLPDRLLPAKTRAFIDFLWQRGDPAQA
ncbi:LysR family transcriptional regulator [Uliginosibacterium sp. H3]|uniref:LysR family transcriptional regulator n=1 Tax=Uliginosibacterium silvisoli TaxID=3114758 RepID=A0ABU6K071_9RHOO|nr:LysR family transcriptional regulator [Uliginosibacterium sp. H3]